LNNII